MIRTWQKLGFDVLGSLYYTGIIHGSPGRLFHRVNNLLSTRRRVASWTKGELLRKVGVEGRKRTSLAVNQSATHVLYLSLAGAHSKRKLLVRTSDIRDLPVAWKGTLSIHERRRCREERPLRSVLVAPLAKDPCHPIRGLVVQACARKRASAGCPYASVR